MANPQTLPKSLHTVTVLVTMARMIRSTRINYSIEDCVYKAMEMLGYAAETDSYGLATMAVKKLNKGE